MAQPAALLNGEQVALEDTFSACGAGDSCIVVDTHCGFCCKYTAINAKNEQLFNKVFDKSCSKFSGQFCQCFDLSSYPSCVDGKCQLVAWPAEMAKQQPRRPATPAPAAAPQPAPPQAEPEPVAEPAPAPVPETLPPAVSPRQSRPVDAFDEPADEPVANEPAQDAFGEAPEQDSRPVDDSLYAPLPDTMPQDFQSREPDPGDPLNKPLPAGR